MCYISNLGTSKNIEKLTHKRNQKIQVYFHKSSRKVVNFAIENKISTIIIGNNENWKQKVILENGIIKILFQFII